MQKIHGFMFAACVGLALGFGGIADAEAKRLGGGGSFGGKSAFSSPYKRSTAQAVRSPRQQQAAQQNQAARQQMAKRGGLMGMLGGLALGGLLGALLFGGAFENINFMDILIFGAIAYLLYRVLAARAKTASPQPAYARTRPDAPRAPLPAPVAVERSGGTGLDGGDWFRGDRTSAEKLAVMPAQDAGATLAGFDESAFLAGARIAYRDLQKAWDARDFDTLKSLTTDTMFGALQERSRDLGTENRTDVLKLDAELLDSREVGGMWEAVVLFDAVLREDVNAQARQVREVWHFTKAADSAAPKWYLDGIQQLED